MGLINRTHRTSCLPPRDEMISNLQVPTGDLDADHHMRSMIRNTGNLAIQKFRPLPNWVFHSVYDFVGGTIRQAAALGFLGSKVPKRLKRQVKIWLTGEQRTSMSRSLAVESEQLLDVIRMAAVNHETCYYMLRKARYPASRAENMQRQEVELARFTGYTMPILAVRHPQPKMLASATNHQVTSSLEMTVDDVVCLVR